MKWVKQAKKTNKKINGFMSRCNHVNGCDFVRYLTTLNWEPVVALTTEIAGDFANGRFI